MGEITVSAEHIGHLLHDPASAYGAPYMQAYADLAQTHRGWRPSARSAALSALSSCCATSRMPHCAGG
ncbi:hypothetical protein [Streptomyces zaomyceticus]|uniref:hypothetical protein n=1 Tax=Streptomyces zaomyceticus TaxID=68286 RepID=UPI0037A66D1E